MNTIQIQWSSPAQGIVAVEVAFGPLKMGLMLPVDAMRKFLEDGLTRLGAIETKVQLVSSFPKA